MQDLKILIFVLLLTPAASFAAPVNSAPMADWTLTDLTTIPELAAFFGNSDAVITVKKDPGDDTIRPTIFLYRLPIKPGGKLKKPDEWFNYLKAYIKDSKRVVLNQDTSKPGRYLVEFTSRNRDSQTDLHSLYLATQTPDRSVTLFIYDGVGPTTTRHLPLVRALFNEMTADKLMDLYFADVRRRKELKMPAGKNP